MAKEIYNFVIEERAGFDKTVNISDGWDWGFKEHIRRSTLYKNSQFEQSNENRDKRPFKNIVRPILNIHYRTEGFDVKDIELYVNNPEKYYKSFLVKKFHEDWALKHEMDTFIDDVVESYVDYGGVLVKNVEGVRPEVVNLQTVAFCDQTDFLSGPFAIQHNLSPQQLREMGKNGWGEKSKGATIDLETLIVVSENQKENDYTQNSTPGKYIEVFEVHGTFPEDWLKGKDDVEEGKYIQQIQIVSFYKDEEDNEIGVTLFSSKEPKLPFKFLERDKVHGRALGFGAVEELFEAQVWTNYSEIQIREMLELASKTFYKTTDSRFKTRNNLINADNGQVFDLQEGKDINQLETTPRNLVVFNDAVERWRENANSIGAAGEILQGEQPSAGTPFKSVEVQLIEGKSLHKWRQGKIAVFVDEIYRDWVLPYISKEIMKGQEFLAELSADELQEVSNQIVNNVANKFAKDKILNGELVFPEEIEELKERARIQFVEGGTNRFIEILKDEFKDAPLDVRTNIAGKQKDLALLTDKVVGVLRQFIATPEIRQDPEMIKLLNTILESSGMSPIIFGATKSPIQPKGGGSTEPLKALAEATPATV